MQQYFIDINKRITRHFQDKGLWGDFILAKRLDPLGITKGIFKHPDDYISQLTTSGEYIYFLIDWDHTPQGYNFWWKEYRNMLK